MLRGISNQSVRVLTAQINRQTLILSMHEGGKQSMSINIRPLGDRVIVEPVEKEETIAGGLLLPETAKEKPQQGKVLAAGAGKRDEDGERIPMDVEVGNLVLFAKYAGTEIKLEGKKLLIMKESDILGIVEE
jgi:chaperonin GroES